ncbi:MAG: molecular chaperone HtpG, partial [Elstera sp.]
MTVETLSEAQGETLAFQAEVSRLLDIVAHALYSEREVFLRELISNAADACDKHRYLALTEPDKAGPQREYAVTLVPDAEAKTLTIRDTGIGMDRTDLIENLGTIARSGTGKFLEKLEGDAKKDFSLIGQFGVGFYSAFMVADKVRVVSRKVGADGAYSWESDGRGSFTVAEAEQEDRGTSITLFLKEDAGEFLDEWRLKAIVRRYSDHIALPIKLKTAEEEETINAASALWTRSKSEVTDEQTKAFYESLTYDSADPFATLHIKAEGALEYSALLYLPSKRPPDLFTADRQSRVKLYARRVFITDDCKDLMPSWLRFVQGVVDSADLPLNVSREMLQNNPVVRKIRSGLVKKIISELEKKAKAEDGRSAYETFWEAFGPVLKEGLYEDFENRQAILGLARFRSSTESGWVSLADYVGRLKPGQKAIYTASGESVEAIAASPHLEGFRAKGVEVLYLTDPIDEFWLPMIGSFEDKPFQSITRGAADLGEIAGEGEEKPAPAPETTPDLAALIERLKSVYGDTVKDVRVSQRLTDSAVCLVADAGDVDLHLEKLLRAHQRLEKDAKRVLEINPTHPVITKL